MSVGFGFSIGDILACGKFCHQIYKACFSEAHDATAAWTALGKELVLLGDALQNLCSDDGIIPQDPFCGPEKEQRALEAVRVVVGDFRETLKDLRAFLLRYDDFQKPDAGKQYWLKIKFSVNSGDVDKFRARVAMHTRAIHLLLNPLIYQSSKKVENTVTRIETRIDTIDQVLHALLVVASEQLTTTSSSRNPGRIADRAHTRPQNGHPQYLITDPPWSPRVIPTLPATNQDMPWGGGQMIRTNSYPATVDRYEDPIDISLRRSSTETNMMNTHSPTSPYSPSSRRGPPADRSSDEGYSSGFSSTSTGVDPSGYGTQRQRSSSGVTELSDNPISRALQQSAMSAKKRPIEHWITAAMHWYFKVITLNESSTIIRFAKVNQYYVHCQAEKDLEDPDNPEVSLEAYLGLMKSSWIVENVINTWEAEDGPSEEMKRSIETLVVLIVDQFRKIGGRKMPDIRNIGSLDYEIWHKDIVPILMEPALPLHSRASSRQSAFGGVYYDDLTSPRRPSQASSHTRTTTPPDSDPSHEDSSGSPASRPSPSLPSSSRTSSLRSSENGQKLSNPAGLTRTNDRSPSISTTSPQPPDDDLESYEGLGERIILDKT
ncbi:hypothetical protein B9Z19DRAFT_290113 [Tuber borchii]|uniref:Fungal N-terminal domain-containing protein n=1 Tax=Tuber borchii TaxID=42251 RepID=A0A2T6ZKK0_TUBBO|nr:hypothetical protein B9Z19DRAFT_290113 [Tuber borchii]